MITLFTSRRVIVPPAYFYTFIVFFILFSVFDGLKRWCLKVIEADEEKLQLARSLELAIRMTVSFLLLTFIGGWSVPAIALLAPCFWAVGSLLSNRLRRIRRRTPVVRRVPPPAPVHRGRRKLKWRASLKSAAMLMFVLFYLYQILSGD